MWVDYHSSAASSVCAGYYRVRYDGYCSCVKHIAKQVRSKDFASGGAPIGLPMFSWTTVTPCQLQQSIHLDRYGFITRIWKNLFFRHPVCFTYNSAYRVAMSSNSVLRRTPWLKILLLLPAQYYMPLLPLCTCLCGPSAGYGPGSKTYLISLRCTQHFD